MNGNFIAAFAAPAIAAVSIGISAAIASGADIDDSAYGATVSKLSADSAATHSLAVFQRADIDGSGMLDADEYVALAIVTAELARLNGFVVLEIGDAIKIVPLPIEAPSALTGGERTRVEAVARSEFYSIADADGVLSASEFAGEQAMRFNAADRNGNGTLAQKELVSFAARAALVSNSDA